MRGTLAPGSGVVARVDLLRTAADHVRHLLHQHVADQLGQVGLVQRPGLNRSPVHHDARRHAGIGREVPAEGYAAVLPWRGRRRWYLLDRELGALELARPALLEPLHRVKDVVVEALSARAVARQVRRDHRTPQAASAPVPPRTRPAGSGDPAEPAGL